MGCRAPGAGLTEQAPTHSAQRRRTRAAERARGAETGGAHLLPLGLVRLRSPPVLEITRNDVSHTTAAPTRLHALGPRRIRGHTQRERDAAFAREEPSPGPLAVHALRHLPRLS